MLSSLTLLCSALIILTLVSWIGWLYHRALKVPPDQQEHARQVLAEVTALCRVIFRVQRNDLDSQRLISPSHSISVEGKRTSDRKPRPASRCE